MLCYNPELGYRISKNCKQRTPRDVIMKHIDHNKIKAMHSAADKLTDALWQMVSWDSDIHKEDDYELARYNYKLYLGILNSLHAGALADTKLK